MRIIMMHMKYFNLALDSQHPKHIKHCWKKKSNPGLVWISSFIYHHSKQELLFKKTWRWIEKKKKSRKSALPAPFVKFYQTQLKCWPLHDLFFIIYKPILNRFPIKWLYAHTWESYLSCCCHEAWITQHQASSDSVPPQGNLKKTTLSA